MSSPVMSNALRLATEFIFNAESNRGKQILLDFNIAKSQVDLIDKEFKQRLIQICEDPSLKEDISCFDSNLYLDLIFIHPDFITFCLDLTP